MFKTITKDVSITLVICIVVLITFGINSLTNSVNAKSKESDLKRSIPFQKLGEITLDNCQGCCSYHGGVVFLYGEPICADGSSMTERCSDCKILKSEKQI